MRDSIKHTPTAYNVHDSTTRPFLAFSISQDEKLELRWEVKSVYRRKGLVVLFSKCSRVQDQWQ